MESLIVARTLALIFVAAFFVAEVWLFRRG